MRTALKYLSDFTEISQLHSMPSISIVCGARYPGQSRDLAHKSHSRNAVDLREMVAICTLGYTNAMRRVQKSANVDLYTVIIGIQFETMRLIRSLFSKSYPV